MNQLATFNTHEVEVEREVYMDDGFVKVVLEKLDGNLFLHVYPTVKVSPALIRYMREVWAMIQWDAYCNDFENIFAYTENHKFMKLMDKDFKVVDAVVKHPAKPDLKLYHKELNYGT